MTDKRQSRRSGSGSPTLELAKALRQVHRVLEKAAGGAGVALPAEWAPTVLLGSASRTEWNHRAAQLLAAARNAAQIEGPAPELSQEGLWCSQCKSAGCDHADLPGPDHTFDGYAPTGKPTWIPFVQLCLRDRPAGMDRLFAEPPGVVVMHFGRAELHESRLASFQALGERWQVAGQVVAGLVPADLRLRGESERLVFTVLVMCTEVNQRRHLRLKLLGMSRAQIDALAASGSQRSPAEQLRRTLKRAQRSLDKLERMELSEGELNGRIDGFLSRLRGDLARVFRAQTNRTKHAQERHQSASRPTSLAVADARGASMERVLFDVPRETYVVLGRKGRAHVFSRSARHVTSIRLEDGEVSRKKRRQRWREVTPSEYRTLRTQLEAHRGGRLKEGDAS